MRGGATIENLEIPAPKRGLLGFFQPAPPVPVTLTDPAAIKDQFHVWQRRVLISSIIGYAVFYFVRKNLPIAMPVMETTLGISKARLGMFLTLQGVIYGISKFVNGFLADRANARSFMVTALIASAALNLLFGFSSSVTAFGLLWMLNGWFQGMGYPPCARLVTHWFPPKQLAVKWSIWNCSHSIGAGLIMVLCGYLVTLHWRFAELNWRLCFWVPAGLALICAAFLWRTLPDTPPSVGLPEVEGTASAPAGGNAAEPFGAFLLHNTFRNPCLWLVAFANFFVYTIRYSVFDWGPTMLKQAKHIELAHAGWMMFGFEVSGLIGALLGGWLTDRFFGGRAIRACVFYMLLAGFSVFLFWKIPAQSELLTTGLLCAAGFFIYGPQCLLAVAAANLATKRAAATAVGLTGLFGYASTVLSGWGLGALVDRYGWNSVFIVLLWCAGIGTLLFVAAWPAKADGYPASPPP